MKICILISKYVSTTGGGQKHLALLIEEYVKAGHFVLMITKKSADTRSLKNVRVIKVPEILPQSRIVSGLSYIIFGLLQIFLHRNEIDVLHAKQMYSSATIGALANWFFKVPVVSKNTATNELGEIEAMKRLPFYKLRIKIFGRVNYFIALTTRAKEEMMGIGIPGEKIEIIPNGVIIPFEASFNSETRLKYRKKLNINKETVLIYTGRFAEEKNLDVMIEAIKKLEHNNIEKLQCIFLGEGGKFRSKEQQLREMVKRYGLNDVILFHPPIKNVYDYLLASDIFFLLSTSEGLSNSLLEGMACGNIILATDIDANRDFLVNGHNSILIPVRDVEETAKAIEIILQDKESWYRLGKNARQKAEKTVSIEEIAIKHCEIYNKAINSLSRGG